MTCTSDWLGRRSTIQENGIYRRLDRRIQATLEDGSVWKYNYNDRNELIGAHRYWADWTPVSGQQYGYDYDNIGNRKTASSGGDTSGWNLRTVSYTANSLNQYSAVTTPGYEDIIGAAIATNGVTVNTLATDRKGEYFHREIAIANSGTPVWQTVSVASAGNTTNGGFAFPKNNQTLTYDLDGNLTFDGIWTYEWDAENRLKAMSMTNTLANLVNSNRLRLEFVYDYQGRRISKTVKTWNGSSFANPVSSLFVYDGWNLIATLNPQLSILNTFLWGQDLSGTMDGAGGVGGLLAVCEMSNGAVSDCHFVSYDGNGNVMALVRARDGITSARYEYSPYGETLRTTGPMAKANPFRFSTKLGEDESGLIYYAYRSYNPVLGRWMGRDPAGEQGGVNLHIFVSNSPLGFFDTDGRWPTRLAQWVGVGIMADTASTLHNLSGMPGAIGLEIAALSISLKIDSLVSGALLKNIGGAGDFAAMGAAGLALGLLPGGFVASQSWGYAIVNGRLQALGSVGKAAGDILRGTSPTDAFSTDGLAYSFVQSARRGDTAYADLDAALLGLSIGFGNLDPHNPSSTLTYNSLAWSFLNRDAAGIAANLPDYMALNAWDMLSETEGALEGL